MVCIAVYTVHMISQNIDGGATETDGGASAPVGPGVATPLSEFLFCHAVTLRRSRDQSLSLFSRPLAHVSLHLPLPHLTDP